jgi:hypothetical protein
MTFVIADTKQKPPEKESSIKRPYRSGKSRLHKRLGQSPISFYTIQFLLALSRLLLCSGKNNPLKPLFLYQVICIVKESEDKIYRHSLTDQRHIAILGT